MLQHLQQQQSGQPATAPTLFGGLSRDSYLQNRVHRKLHPEAAGLNDEALSEFGKLSFNEQFRALGHTSDIPVPVAPNGAVDWGGMGREGYLSQRIHRQLQPHAATLPDNDLLELGKMSFRLQFESLGQSGPQEQKQSSGDAPPRGAPPPGSTMFGDLDRAGFIRQRIHRWLHSRAEELSDEALLELGRLSFNEQFPVLGVDGPHAAQENKQQHQAQQHQAPQQQRYQSQDYFGGQGRDAYVQQRIHRKLHAQVASYSDSEIFELGQLSFNDQFQVLGAEGPRVQQQQALFGDAGRDGYMQQRVHRKLHAEAAALPDQELFELGKMSFNEQFPALNKEGPGEQHHQQHHQQQPQQQNRSGSLFGPAGRDGYLQQRVHRKLHDVASTLSDEDLHGLGQLGFNEQFPAMQQQGPMEQRRQRDGPDHDATGVDFGGLDRDGYMNKSIHRKLHARAATMGDQQLLELGKLSFNDQFPALGVDGGAEPRGPDLFGEPGRDGFLQQRVHRKLHAPAAQLSDQDLMALGKLSFNDQFHAMGADGGFARRGSANHAQQSLFGESGRDGYMQQRVHRKLHSRAATLSDEDLFELGKRSFNDQFPSLGLDSAAGAGDQQQMLSRAAEDDAFGGQGRQGFMSSRVHRRLHAQAAQLSDQDLLELGQKSFNEQFHALGV